MVVSRGMSVEVIDDLPCRAPRYRGMITATSTPCRANARGNVPATSASPPVLANPTTSEAASNTRSGADAASDTDSLSKSRAWNSVCRFSTPDSFPGDASFRDHHTLRDAFDSRAQIFHRVRQHPRHERGPRVALFQDVVIKQKALAAHFRFEREARQVWLGAQVARRLHAIELSALLLDEGACFAQILRGGGNV